MDHPGRTLVDLVRADPRHPAAAELGHPVIQHRARRIAGSDDPGPGDAERPLDRPDADGLGLLQRHIVAQCDIGRAPGVELVAVRAVGLQVRPRPAIEIGRLVVGIDELRQLGEVGRPGQEPQLVQGRELVGRDFRLIAPSCSTGAC